MRGIGDLVISRARLTDSLSRMERHVPAVEWRSVQENAATLDRQLRMLREGVMRIRLVPVGEIFRRMPFVVRDLGRETGRKVLLNLRGQTTEIDKYLIERLMDPVLHLVRNAVSHGIEAPDVRTANGKSAEGTITLSASTVGEVVVLEIADDGRGIDEAAVWRRRVKRGSTCRPVRSIARRCWQFCARRASPPRTRPIGQAVVAWAWPSSRTRSRNCLARSRSRPSRARARASLFSCR